MLNEKELKQAVSQLRDCYEPLVYPPKVVPVGWRRFWPPARKKARLATLVAHEMNKMRGEEVDNLIRKSLTEKGDNNV